MSYTASYIVNSSSAQGTTDFQFTFPYIKEEHIEVYLNYSKITQGSGSAQYQVITNVSPKLIRLNTGLASANLRVEIRRNSSLGSPLVDYADGSTLTANDLDTSALQSLYIDQELKDNQGKAVSVDEATGLPTLNNARLTNVANPTAAQDAATKNYVDTTAEPKSAKLTELATMAQNTANALADLTEAEVQAIDGLTASTDELNKLDGVTATTTELNYVDGVTSNIQTQLDAKQASDAELTELATMGSTTASALADLTQAEVQILDGATVSTDELNKLDGVTASTTEINKLDGVTASTAEINKLDGVTATTAELNKLDGVTATTDELNKTDGLLATPTELNTLDGITSNTSELNKLDGVTATTAELNIVAGKSFKTSSGTLDTTSDTEIPSSKVIAAHVASSQTAIGGFTTIADEVSFPNTQPATGVVVSINNAAGVVINSSGVSTSGKRVDNTTVTINGFPSSLNGETLAAGVGLIVVSTSTANTYNYHKILTSETDVKQLSDDINDFNSRYRIAGSPPSSNNDEGDLYFDTAANKMKVYNGSSWDDVASVGSFFVNTLSSSGSGSDTIPGGSATFNGTAKKFTLSNPGTSAQQHIVSVNGVIQKPNSGTGVPSEGFALSGNDIIFSTAPASGSDFFIITCGSSVSIGTPSANSVNSSHIIDGSIVDGDISSTANIAGSKIADDSITEVKLDISNAPTDGYFLKYKDSTDKLTWAAAADTDAIRALASQATSTFVQAIDTGTDGRVVIELDGGEKARFTSDGLAIGTTTLASGMSANANHLALKNSHHCGMTIIAGDDDDCNINFTDDARNMAGAIKYSNDGDYLALYTDASERFRIASAGQLGIGGATYGTSGQVLTSGGSGAAPSWTTISAAPEVTGTATGAIATGGAVVCRSDGNFEAITGVASGLGSGENNYFSGNIDSVTSCKLSDGHIVVIYQKDSDSQAYTKVGTVSGSGKNSTISWSSVETNLGVSSPSNAASKIVMIPLSGSQDAKVAVAYRWSNRLAVKIGRITGSGTTKECEFGSGIYMEHGGQNYQVGDFDICWTGSSRYIMACFARVGGSTRWNVSRVVVPSSGYSISGEAKGTDVTSGDWYSNRIVWSPDENKALCFATNSSGIVKMSVATPTSTDTNVTSDWSLNTSSQPASPSDHEEGACVYDTSSNKILYAYTQQNVRHICGFVITMSGTSQPSKGSLLTKTDFGTNTTDEFDYLSMAYDSDNNKINIQCHNKTTSAYKHIIGSISGTSFSGTLYDLDSSSPRDGGGTVNDYGNGLFAHTFNKGSSSSALKFYQLPSSNLTTGNFVGFASAGVSNGQTVTVKVTGNTLTTSGLTPGIQYFVGGDGTLSTTAYSEAEVKAGIALASNKLLIRQ